MGRPAPRFHNFIGHKKIVDLLCRQLAGAVARKEPFPHSRFVGPSGVGKTLLAEALAAEFGAAIVRATGYETKEELAELFIGLNHGDFLFIDEVHRLKQPAQELLYQVIDHLQVPRTKPKKADENEAADWKELVTVKPCTVILATDQPGRLLNALHKRAPIQVTLNYYNLRELKEIVDCLAFEMNLLLSPQSATLIAKVSGGLPRKAKHHLENLRRHYPNSENLDLGSSHVRKFLRAFSIDEKGLGSQDRQVLRHLRNVKVASLESLAIRLGVDPGFVRHQIEPLLFRHDFITIGSGGRQMTEAGLRWLEVPQLND